MRGVKVEIAGKEYALVFTLNALMQVTERFGGLDEMAEQTQGPEIAEDDTPKVRKEKQKAQLAARVTMFKELPWLIALLANQGIMLSGKNAELLTPEYVGLCVAPNEFPRLMDSAMAAIAVGMNAEAKETETEEVDVILREIERKNGESGGE